MKWRRAFVGSRDDEAEAGKGMLRPRGEQGRDGLAGTDLGPWHIKEIVKQKGSLCWTCKLLKCWPEDGGRYITLPMVFSKEPGNGQAQLRHVQKFQVYDERDGHALADA
jgi:hypothetical protein